MEPVKPIHVTEELKLHAVHEVGICVLIAHHHKSLIGIVQYYLVWAITIVWTFGVDAVKLFDICDVRLDQGRKILQIRHIVKGILDPLGRKWNDESPAVETEIEPSLCASLY